MKLKIVMRAKGTVKLPDGTIKHIVLRAEKPLKEKEAPRGDNLKRGN
jgi:hypothetical protein